MTTMEMQTIRGRRGVQRLHTIDSLAERMVEEGECLLWTGYHGNRVPMVSHGGQMIAVRRLMARLDGSEREGGYYVPVCGNRSCVAPAHTAWRSEREHSGAMAQAQAASPAAQMLRRARISRSKGHKLTDEQIAEVLNSNESGPALAARLGVSRTLISKLRRRGGGISPGANPWLQLMT